MKQLSRERLEKIISRIEEANKHGGVGVTRDEGMEMAQMLLEGMVQEAVQVVECWACKQDVEVSAIGDCDGYCPNCGNPIDLDDEPYAAPPAPVVPDTVTTDCGSQGIPDRIWLNTAGEWPADGTEGQVTWCLDQQHELDTMYVRSQCWCRTCRPVTMSDMRFVVCPDCGNKRCPKGNDHRHACGGSNEPGQEGSAYQRLSEAAEVLNRAAPNMLADESLKDPGGALCGRHKDAGWIPCSERMPEGSQYVLVFDPEEGQRVASLLFGSWVYGASWDVNLECYPTHWQPLPAPPKDGV